MKNTLKLLFFALVLTACGKTSDKGFAQIDSLKTAHQALYNQTMDIHDEVMPQMDRLYKLKKSLTDSIAKTPKLSAEAKAAIENRINLLDSANDAMMTWMHQFNPPDSVASPVYREYMEKELEKVKQLKTLILNAK